MRKPTVCICKNKGADQLCANLFNGNLCRTWSEIPKTDFVVTQLTYVASGSLSWVHLIKARRKDKVHI